MDALDAALHAVGPGALVAFDADGTLWSGDVGLDVFDALLDEHAILPEAGEALRREAADVGLAAPGTPTDVARALRGAWAAGRYDELRAFSMMAWAFAGWRTSDVEAFAERVFERRALTARVHPSLAAVFAWVERERVDTLVVSASSEVVVRAALRHAGLPLRDVVAMQPRIQDGVVHAELALPAVYGAGKVDALRRARPGATVLAAFGDSGYDAAMLLLARVRVLVAPKPALIEAMQRVDNVFVLDQIGGLRPNPSGSDMRRLEPA